ncbi:MAG TPA: hypothetical protein VHF27_12840 [Acidimicrobiales bacterium]|nr:hypothetical protein [Acidimicrobiales bacterium]
MGEVRVRLSPGRWAVLVAAAVLVAGVGASAFACANLATLNLSATSGRPGATVTITGASFIGARATNNFVATPVVIRWNDKDGPVLAEVTPDRRGAVSASFTVPDVSPGTYVILGIQETPRRAVDAPPDAPPAYFAEPGTPARASFEVVAPGRSAVVRPPAGEAVDAPESQGELDSTVWIVLTAAFGAVAMSLFGGGLIAFIHQSRKAREPAAARWIPPGW